MESLHTHTGASGGGPRELLICTPEIGDAGGGGEDAAPGATSLSRPFREPRLAAGGVGRGRAPPYTFHARLPHKVGLCLDPLAPSPGEQQQRGRRGRARRGGDDSGSSGPAIPGLEPISGDTGGTWRGSVPAEPKRDAGPQAQPSWGATQATRGGPG